MSITNRRWNLRNNKGGYQQLPFPAKREWNCSKANVRGDTISLWDWRPDKTSSVHICNLHDSFSFIFLEQRNANKWASLTRSRYVLHKCKATHNPPQHCNVVRHLTPINSENSMGPNSIRGAKYLRVSSFPYLYPIHPTTIAHFTGRSVYPPYYTNDIHL